MMAVVIIICLDHGLRGKVGGKWKTGGWERRERERENINRMKLLTGT